LTLLTLGRGDGLLGMMGFGGPGTPGPRGGNVSLAQVTWTYTCGSGPTLDIAVPAPELQDLTAASVSSTAPQLAAAPLERDFAAETAASALLQTLGFFLNVDHVHTHLKVALKRLFDALEPQKGAPRGGSAAAAAAAAASPRAPPPILQPSDRRELASVAEHVVRTPRVLMPRHR